MSNKELVELFVSPIRECMEYKPHFGDSSRTGGYSLPDFLRLYGSDPFYSWIGLDSPYVFRPQSSRQHDIYISTDRDWMRTSFS